MKKRKGNVLKGFISKILVFVLLVSSSSINNLPISYAAGVYDAEFQIMQQRLLEDILGTPYDLSKSFVANKVKNISDEALNYYNTIDKSYNKTYLWSDIQGLNINEVPIGRTLNRLRTMAMAYRMPGTQLYQNNNVVDVILDSLHYIDTNFYNENTNMHGLYSGVFSPSYLGDIIILLDEFVPKVDTPGVYDLQDYARTFDAKNPHPVYNSQGGENTGGNLGNSIQAHIKKGIVTKDVNNMALASEALKLLFVMTEEGDGFYEDGSFIQHKDNPALFVYSYPILDSLGSSLYLLADTPWELQNSPEIESVYDFIYNAFEPGAINGTRAISLLQRHGMSWPQPRIRHMINTLALVAESAPEHHKIRIHSMLKRWLIDGKWVPEAIIYPSSSLTQIKRFNDMMENNISASDKYTNLKFWASQDRLFKHTDDWTLELSMYSDRIRDFETINGNNLQAWHSASGSTLIHNTNPEFYWDGYFAAMNKKRIPGTTVLKDAVRMEEKSVAVKADAYVNSASSNSNYGNKNRIVVSNKSGEKIGYTYFEIYQYETISNGKLMLYGKSTDGSTAPVTVAVLNDVDWVESGLKWSNRPSTVVDVLDTIEVGPEEKYYEWDVTKYLRKESNENLKGTLIIYIEEGSHSVEFNSKEDGTMTPKLWWDKPTHSRSENSWVGGTQFQEQYASIGMDYTQSGFDLSAKKSYFIFDDEIVCLGTDITSTDGIETETIVDNRRLNDQSGNNTFAINGSNKSTTLGSETTYNNTKSIYIAGETPADDIGYYFPNGEDVIALREQRIGTYQDNDYLYGSKGDYTRYFMNLIIDHGVDPYKESYEYVILPSTSQSRVSSYETSPEIEILSNNSEVQAVREKTLNITGINFWEDELTKVDIITSNKKASVTYREEDGVFELGISDPTQDNEGFIDIEIDKAFSSILSNDPEITVYEMGEKTKLSVATKKSAGKTYTIKFDVARPCLSENNLQQYYYIGKGNTGETVIEFDVNPQKNNIDGNIGLTDAAVVIDSLSELAVNIRMNPSGALDVLNGDTYSALTNVPYSVDKRYHIKIAANLDNETYDVWVKERGSTEIKIAQDYSFGVGSLPIKNLGKIILNSQVNSDYTLENIATKGTKPEITVIPETLKLNDLVLSAGMIKPLFESHKTSYKLTVDNTVTSITARAISEGNRDLVINGNTVASNQKSQEISLVEGFNTVEILLRGDNGEEKVYSVVVTRKEKSLSPSLDSNANLSGLQLSDGTLIPSFDPNITEYTLNDSVDSTRITATVESSHYTNLVIQGEILNSGETSFPIPITVEDNIIRIVVSAEDGTPKVYTITRDIPPISNPYLEDIRISDISLSPSFEGNIKNYEVKVPYTLKAITIVPVAESSLYGDIRINGDLIGSNEESQPINLSIGDNIIELVVTSGDQSYSEKYTLKIIREGINVNTNLSSYGLYSASTGNGSLAFDQNTSSHWLPNGNNGEWVSIDFQEPIKYDRVTIRGTSDNGVTSYVLQSSDDGINYVNIPKTDGTTIGLETNIIFTPVTSRYLRFYINTAAKTPEIKEIEVYDKNNDGAWYNDDIGEVAVEGSVSFNNDNMTVIGEGKDIWMTADSFHYAYKKISGDFSISARVVSQENTYEWAKAGVMIRETLDVDSKFAMSVLTPGHGVSFQWRLDTGKQANSRQVEGKTEPVYVKIERAGNRMSSYYSHDGSTWSMIDSPRDIPMNNEVYIGMAVTSHYKGSPSEVVFDNIRVEGQNFGPEAYDDYIEMANGTMTEIDVVANDYDKNGDILTVISMTQPTNGTVTFGQGNKLEYTPNQGFSGTDTFEYTISDGVETSTAIVTITTTALPLVNVVSLYQNGNFGSSGYKVDLPVGNYLTTDLVANGVLDNDVSSVKVIPGYIVTLYDGDNFTGDNIVLTEDTDIVSIFNDKVSSIKIELDSSAILSALSLSGGSLEPTFNSYITNYTMNVDSTVTETTITATAASPLYGLTVNGTAVVNGIESSSIALSGNDKIDIVVTAEDSTTKTYTVTITKNYIPLKDYFNGTFNMGAAPNINILKDSEHEQLFLKHFNMVGSHNSFKIDVIRKGSQGEEWRFSDTDYLVNFAETNGLKMRAHGPIWHASSSAPAWMFQDDNGNQLSTAIGTYGYPLSRDTVLNKIREHYTVLFTRYKDKIDYWDVVNEAVAHDGNGLRVSPYRTHIGDDYIEQVFIICRDILNQIGDTRAKLFYNDYGEEWLHKSQAIYDIIQAAINNGAPIDGIGMQAHIEINTPLADYETAIQRFKALGIEMHITELDVGIYKTLTQPPYDSYDTIPEDVLIEQGHYFKALFDLFEKYKNDISLVSCWGVTDADSWRNSPTKPDAPLYFNPQLLPKYAYYGMIDDISQIPEYTSNINGITLSQGTIMPEFDRSVLSYSTSVENNITEVSVTVDSTNSIKINGQPAINGQPSDPIPLVEGNNYITVELTADDGSKQTYTITVSRGIFGSYGWYNQDIGSVLAAGSTTYNNYALTINGSGTDIWGDIDEFQYAYKKVNGDFTIIARVVSQTNTHPWAKAGVMMRDTVDPNSKFAMIVMTPSNGVNYQWRNNTGGSCNFDQDGSVTAPQYVKLERVGDRITSFYSADSLSWTQIGAAQSISMNEKVLVGLAVTSHNDGVLSEAVFDNIQILTGESVLDNNANLSNLILSEGTLEPTFDPETTDYIVTVDNTVTEISFTAIAESLIHSDLTINSIATISGEASYPIALEVGNNVVNILVTAEDGTTKTYTVNITRADVSSANVVSLYQHGNYGGYQVDFPVGNYVTADLVAYGVKDNDVSSLKVTSGYKVTLYDGDNFTGNSLVLTEDTDIVKIFNDKVSSMKVEQEGAPELDSNADLSGLSLSASNLAPAFSSGTISYAVGVDNRVTEITVTATADSTLHSGLTINGTVVTSGVASYPIALEVGNNVVNILVTAEDGTTKAYTVNITRADIPSANVVSLYQNGNYGGYKVDFPVGNYLTSDLVAYGVKDNDVSSVKVTSGYKVTLYDGDNCTGSSIVLTEDTDIVSVFNDKTSSMIVELTSQSSSTATLSYLETSVGALSSNFNGNTLSYDVYVDNSVTETTIIATPTNSNYSGLTINGTVVVSGVASEAIALKVGNNPIDIMVIAEDGLTTMTYTVNVHRNPEGISTGNIVLNKPATVSNVFGGNQNWNGSKAVDEDPSTRWATNSGLEEVWLEVDFEALVTFNKTVIKEFQTHGNRVDSYKIKYWDGTNWQDAYTGGSLQAEQSDTFSDVTTTKVRLILTDYDQSGPSIWEFKVFYQ